jgi:acetoacetyl-[acyl-carrier protein] synthase
MSHSLPVIVGFGGYNAAGRSSSHQAFRRMVFESLPSAEQQETVVGLACLMGLVQKQAQGYTDHDGTVLSVEQVDANFRAQVLDGTLIRKIGLFDPSAVAGHKKINIGAEGLVFSMTKRDLPTNLPEDWQIRDLEDGTVEVTASQAGEYLV